MNAPQLRSRKKPSQISVNSREDIEESGFEDCEESEEEDSERLVPSSIEPVNKYLHEYSSVEVVSQNDDKSFITLNHSEGDGIGLRSG